MNQPKLPSKPDEAAGFDRPAQATLAAAVQTEQRRIAQALHDTVSQSLTGTYFQASAIARKLQTSGSEAADDVARLVAMVHQVVIELQEVVRSLQPKQELHPE